MKTKAKAKLKSPKQVPVRNRTDPTVEMDAALEMMAEQLGSLTQGQIDNFVLQQLPKLPGYHVRGALAILDNLTKFRERYFL